MHKNAIKIVGGVKFSKKYLKMWDFLSKNCGIFSSKGGTKIWDFRRRGGDFRHSGFGHTVFIVHSSINHLFLFVSFYPKINYQYN